MVNTYLGYSGSFGNKIFLFPFTNYLPAHLNIALYLTGSNMLNTCTCISTDPPA